MKQEERRQQTIQLLLDSTKQLIAAKGCDTVTLKDIMEQTGLSKGAIFHYVKSKDDIFAWVLQEQLEETNRRFHSEVTPERPSFEGPMSRIVESLSALEDAQNMTNKVLMYFLGKEHQPGVAELLTKFYERSKLLSEQWITTGQQHGVIPNSVDAVQTAELFVLISLGLRVRSSFSAAPSAFSSKHFTSLMTQLLKS